jgi:hypothetical protein
MFPMGDLLIMSAEKSAAFPDTGKTSAVITRMTPNRPNRNINFFIMLSPLLIRRRLNPKITSIPDISRVRGDYFHIREISSKFNDRLNPFLLEDVEVCNDKILKKIISKFF